ncbi:UDP-N-acetylmuramate dehydrogenase [Alphaproteobacteria bacterium]|nr:UDP-N-acetylmuramate dehydrogenase [PS1 clade bacterium]MBL6783426.1 UDP-N-acetylmuramate dehydrogenase [PS1 clade bacterium]MDB2523034.1 UDP-N-acetylmuramate dehydrogenase [Alphaproteobacteria bacterium]
MTAKATPANMTHAPEWLAALPPLRGKLMTDLAMGDICWFRVGGPADVVFMPADTDDLAAFLKALPAHVPLAVLGAGSNVLVRDGGLRGAVIRLGAAFGEIAQTDETALTAGAAALDVRVARAAADASIAGLAFYRGIPGAIGGAVAMNAGAYGGETCDVLVEVEWLDRDGEKHVSAMDALNLSYRHNGHDGFKVYTAARLKGARGDKAKILAEMEAISDKREDSQPVKARTGGSTFKNPDGADPTGLKAWKLIDAAGCRGLRVGDAQVSEQHCNFLINHGVATAGDLETLGETVRQRVQETSGVELQWEIKRMGEARA